MTYVRGCGKERWAPPTLLPSDVTFVSFIGVLRRIDNGGTAATSTLIVLERILETAAVFFTIFTILPFPLIPSTLTLRAVLSPIFT